MSAHTDDAELAARVEYILAELDHVQDKLGEGYLSAFPTEHFDRLQNLQPVWAPFYVVSPVATRTGCYTPSAKRMKAMQTDSCNSCMLLAQVNSRRVSPLQIHKIMAGLLDQFLFTGNDLALHMVTDMAAYFVKRVDHTIEVNGTQHWHNMLNNEFGGMSEVLYNLYDITKDREHAR